MFQTYPNLSIKSFEHEQRESDSFSFHRRIVNSHLRNPLQWKKYLSKGENKKELIKFLFDQWTNARLELKGISA